MKRFLTLGIFLGLAVLSAVLRWPRLEQRPMHCDEAVHADKFGTLLEQGRYEYSPQEFHGPTLNYLTLLSARIAGLSRYTEINEQTLRIVPAVAGVLLVAVHALLIPVLGLPAAAVAALLTALSPAMVFFSRYYIHEMLLVLFTFTALISTCRYLLRPALGWALAAGASVGLMHATKETAIIAGTAMFLGGMWCWIECRSKSGPRRRFFDRVKKRHLLLALAAAAALSALFFSSFGTYPQGIVDSIRAYPLYLDRAGSNPWHIHPWYYYLQMLIFWRSPGGPFWTEGLIIVLGLVGLMAAWKGLEIPGVQPQLLRFLAIFTLLMVLFYSLIPYKTPWCLLGFLHGLVLLGGAGAVRCFSRLSAAMRLALGAVLLASTLHLGWQAWLSSFPMDSDPRNPYVYAHTGKDVFQIVQRVEALAQVHSDGWGMPVQVISRENLWPLPWYLRRFTRVGWWNGISPTAPVAPVILASPDMETALIQKLYESPPPGERELYMNVFEKPLELRPQVEIRGYAAKSLWDDFRRWEATAGSAPIPGRP